VDGVEDKKTLHMATSKSKSLCTTVPVTIIRQLSWKKAVSCGETEGEEER
jgi:hypothetical protein